MRIAGIYKIKNIFTGRSYIGSSTDIAECWKQHRADFANGVNQSQLQKSWDEFGPSAFQWILLERISNPDNLLKREEFHLTYQSRNDFNRLTKIVEAPKLIISPPPPEDHPEVLIKIIQNQSGKVSKEEREAALIDLIRRFQYLIRKVTNSLFFGYNLGKKYNWDIKDFRQDVFADFIDLVINDFKIKEDLEDTGLAVFGNYIKIKLYRRVQYHLQEKLRRGGYDNEAITNYDDILLESRDKVSNGFYSIPMYHEIREAIVANSLNYDEVVMQHMSDERCSQILSELQKLSHIVLTERDRTVWELYFLSGMMVGEIGQHISSKIETDKGIGRSRVLQIARDSNDKILREYGRRVGIQKAAL